MAWRERQNVTGGLPWDVGIQLRHQAVDDGRSLSAYAAEILQRAAHETSVYEAARAYIPTPKGGGFAPECGNRVRNGNAETVGSAEVEVAVPSHRG